MYTYITPQLSSQRKPQFAGHLLHWHLDYICLFAGLVFFFCTFSSCFIFIMFLQFFNAFGLQSNAPKLMRGNLRHLAMMSYFGIVTSSYLGYTKTANIVVNMRGDQCR